MKIHGMCVTKNENDFIRRTLVKATEWCDYIYVFDNGSTDGTWDTVLELSQTYKSIIPFKQDACVFVESLRRDIFEYYRENGSVGDWWCRLDSDEIYIDNPKVFLANIPKHFDVVWCVMLNYYFTDKDVQEYEKLDSEIYTSEPIDKKLRYYKNSWSEPRFFRDSNSIVWLKGESWPSFMTASDHRIRMKHYQYRSPEQIQKRIEIRRNTSANGGFSFPHEVLSNWSDVITNPLKFLNKEVVDSTKKFENEPLLITGQEWKERIISAAELDYDARDGGFVVNEDLMPPIPTFSMMKFLVKKIIRLIIAPFYGFYRKKK